jgi:hypothetical protein
LADIFLSYRRGDTAGHAGRLFDGLKACFPSSKVFMDVDSIMPGANFKERIETAVASCNVALVLIGDDWLDMKGPDGTRRLENPEDFIRLEVSAALSRGVNVIPVLVEGATMPSSAELPEEIKPLALRNAIELSDGRWSYDMGRLTDAIGELSGMSTASARRRRPALSVSRKVLGGVGAAVAAAAIAVVAGVLLIGGDGDVGARTTWSQDQVAAGFVARDWFESADPSKCELVTEYFLENHPVGKGKQGPAALAACKDTILAGDLPRYDVDVLSVDVNGDTAQARIQIIGKGNPFVVALERVGGKWKVDSRVT